jgi:hypothetical protein
MEVVGTAVGIASLGIQVCQGLLDYYDDWKGYSTDIKNAYDSIDDLDKTLKSLQKLLEDKDLDQKMAEEVRDSLQSCGAGLKKLQEKLEKLRSRGDPQGFRQKVWAESQRALYPFKASTLVKLREIVAEILERLQLGVQVLQLGVGISTHKNLGVVVENVKDTAARTVNIETQVAQNVAQTQHLLSSQRKDQHRMLANWISAPDPWTDHATARHSHEAHTGSWLLQDDKYLDWKAGNINVLWLYGKAGCGKTVLSSTAIEDMKGHCSSSASNIGHAVFYFSFSDDRKQGYADLLRSLAVQLALKEPGLSMLQQAYDKPQQGALGAEELERIAMASIASYDAVYLQLDALDECPESGNARQHTLDGLEKLARAAANLRILATSREILDVRQWMDSTGAVALSIPTDAVDLDIDAYVSAEVARDPRLSKLQPPWKTLIEDTFKQKADGM